MATTAQRPKQAATHSLYVRLILPPAQAVDTSAVLLSACCSAGRSMLSRALHTVLPAPLISQPPSLHQTGRSTGRQVDRLTALGQEQQRQQRQRAAAAPAGAAAAAAAPAATAIAVAAAAAAAAGGSSNSSGGSSSSGMTCSGSSPRTCDIALCQQHRTDLREHSKQHDAQRTGNPACVRHKRSQAGSGPSQRMCMSDPVHNQAALARGLALWTPKETSNHTQGHVATLKESQSWQQHGAPAQHCHSVGKRQHAGANHRCDDVRCRGQCGACGQHGGVAGSAWSTGQVAF